MGNGRERSVNRVMRVVLVGLAVISMVFPVYFFSLILGSHSPENDLLISVGFLVVPVLAMGTLLLWAVREVQRSEDLKKSKRLTWYAVFTLSGFIGAFCFLWSRAGTESGSALGAGEHRQ